VRLHEKGGKRHEMPAHTSWSISSTTISPRRGSATRAKAPSSAPVSKTGVLTDKPMNRIEAYRMIGRRTAEAGFKIKLGCHVFRATGITALPRGGRHARATPR
jgi:hypothetical protein